MLTIYCSSITAQKIKTNRNNNVEDKIALKELVALFSVLADKKDTQGQTLLFTENANVTSIIGGNLVSNLTGRKQIGDAFTAFLDKFETVYHLNGQQIVTVNGNNATGISYCLVTLIGDENGKKMKTIFGIHYEDSYLKIKNKWLIDKRKSIFDWQEKQELKN